MSIFATNNQISGRGQGDHSWFSSPGKNITASVACRFSGLPASESQAISNATALAVLDYLSDEGVAARIKWPNDIWVGQRKICGLLIENVIIDGMTVATIAGIGLNLNERQWPEELPNPVSLWEISGKEYDVREELYRLVKKIRRRFAMIDNADGRISLQEEFEQKVFRLP